MEFVFVSFVERPKRKCSALSAVEKKVIRQLFPDFETLYMPPNVKEISDTIEDNPVFLGRKVLDIYQFMAKEIKSRKCAKKGMSSTGKLLYFWAFTSTISSEF